MVLTGSQECTCRFHTRFTQQVVFFITLDDIKIGGLDTAIADGDGAALVNGTGSILDGFIGGIHIADHQVQIIDQVAWILSAFQQGSCYQEIEIIPVFPGFPLCGSIHWRSGTAVHQIL